MSAFRIIAALLPVLLLAACGGGDCYTPLPPDPPDYSPIGDGLKLIAFCMVGTAVVASLGRLLR